MNEKAVIDKLFDQDKKFERLEKKLDDKFDHVLTVLDQQTEILMRLDHALKIV